MKKAILILGGFTLMMTGPIMAQEKATTLKKEVKSEPKKVEKVRLESAKELKRANPESGKLKEKKKFVKGPKIKATKPVESRKPRKAAETPEK